MFGPMEMEVVNRLRLPVTVSVLSEHVALYFLNIKKKVLEKEVFCSWHEAA